jgi:hypothetical protein
MGQTFYSTNVLLAIILFLSVLLMLNTIYGCKYPRFMERFEDKVMSEESTEKEVVKKEASGKPPSDADIKILMDKIKSDAVPEEAVTEEKPTAVPVTVEAVVEKNKNLSTKETELFQAIVNEKISTQDLEKLVKAGIVTEDTIEKFLNEMDNSKKLLEGAGASESVIEGFSCGRDYATF